MVWAVPAASIVQQLVMHAITWRRVVQAARERPDVPVQEGGAKPEQPQRVRH